MKFVLIGGAGYIGSQLTRALDSRGFTVTVIDNFTYNQNTYFPPSVNVVKDDIENIKTHQADIASADYVFFMASPRLNEINDLPQPLPYLDALKDTVELLGEKKPNWFSLVAALFTDIKQMRLMKHPQLELLPYTLSLK